MTRGWEHPTERLPRRIADPWLLGFAVASRLIREWMVLVGHDRAVFLAESAIGDPKTALELRYALWSAFGG